ncbi:MAG: LysR family transcriptional regulator [Burkholderiales bacterium]
MDKLNAMQVFVAVVDCGSQSAAADRLDLSRPVVSRYLAELEAWAGTRLMHRTTRRLSLTAAGSETLARCRQVLELTGDMRAAVADREEAPQGLLRITVSTSFAQAQLAPAVAGYVKRYPGVAIDMVVLDRAVNLVDERIDLAIRITNDLDPNLIARRLTVCRSVVCASAAYLREHAAPRRLEELSLHNCLTHSYYGKTVWHFERAAQPVAIAVSGNISANDSTSIVQAALSGAGVALLPTYLAAPLIRAGHLIALLPQAKPRELSIHAVYASRKHMSAALRTMLDFLAERFAPEPSWDATA